MIIRRFSTLLSITRQAQAVSLHVSSRRPSEHHHKGGGSPFLPELVSSGAASILLPSSNCPPVRDHASLLQHQQCGLLLRRFLHSNSRLKQPKQTKTVEIEIISEENIKPASPTPNHLRTFKFSILDQTFYPFHTPCVLYFHNAANTSLTDVISNISRNLKTSLSELLTLFYPFAGRIKDDFEIDCNDEGVYFAKTRVNCNLLDFLSQPDDHVIQQLLPQDPSACRKSMLRSYVVSVQVNIFDCGGIALSTSVSHKLIDGTSYITFLKAWAATMRGSSEVILPSFIATSLFPQSRYLKNSLPTKMLNDKNTITRRFVFSATALTSLKAKALPSSSSVQGPTRVEAASSLIWKCAAKAASQVRSFSQQSPHIMISYVNLRKRDSPQLPPESIGNLILGAVAVSFPKAELELPSLTGQVKKSIANINYDLFSKFKGKEGYLHFDGLLKLYSDFCEPLDEGDILVFTSLCKSGHYEIDFGWGKPVWFSYINPGVSRIAALVDTVNGDGMEAIVSLSREEMAIFERDEELLSYTSMNQSPLILLGIGTHASRL